jgi:hypothetical protein
MAEHRQLQEPPFQYGDVILTTILVLFAIFLLLAFLVLVNALTQCILMQIYTQRDRRQQQRAHIAACEEYQVIESNPGRKSVGVEDCKDSCKPNIY